MYFGVQNFIRTVPCLFDAIFIMVVKVNEHYPFQPILFPCSVDEDIEIIDHAEAETTFTFRMGSRRALKTKGVIDMPCHDFIQRREITAHSLGNDIQSAMPYPAKFTDKAAFAFTQALQLFNILGGMKTCQFFLCRRTGSDVRKFAEKPGFFEKPICLRYPFRRIIVVRGTDPGRIFRGNAEIAVSGLVVCKRGGIHKTCFPFGHVFLLAGLIIYGSG
mgnify:CR=1 FL=1